MKKKQHTKMEKILEVFSKTGWGELLDEDYKEFMVSINAGSWRTSHPDDFKLYCYLAYLNDERIYAYDFNWFFYPKEITKMVLTGEVSLKDLDEATTVIIRSMDEDVEQRLLTEPEHNTDTPKERQPGFIYLIKSQKYYKIGRTLNLESRFKTYRTENPHGCKMICSCRVSDYSKTEKDLCQYFKDKQYRGEWFEFSDDDVVKVKELFKELK